MAQQPSPLLTGAVRDPDGRAIAGASVTALDATGALDGTDTTDGAGTFALAPARPAVRIRIQCQYCATQTAAVSVGGEPLVVIVRRFDALRETGLSQRDLQVLPYGRTSDALGLVPYLVPAQPSGGYGRTVSDRGLNLGYAQILDEGAPAYDQSGAASPFDTSPDRAIQHIDLQPARLAYRYGNAAGGGTFVLDELGEDDRAATAYGGPNPSVAAYARMATLAPALAESWDIFDGARRRRAGVDFASDVAGGVLRAGVATSDQQPIADSWTTAVDESLVHVDYATASRRYRTFADAAASQTGVQESIVYGDASARSSTVVASLRVEHPGPLLTAFGVVGQRYAGSYNVSGLAPLTSWFSTDAAYLEASLAQPRLSLDGALDVSQLHIQTSQEGYRRDAALNLVLPSLFARYAIAGGLSVRASASASFRAANLTELDVLGSSETSPFERGSVVDGGIEYDDERRLRLDAMVFRENLSGFEERSTTGVGFSAAWQISPLLSLRAWTLHDAADETSPPLPYVPYVPLDLSRSVAWLSYDNRRAIRFDVILHADRRDARSKSAVDGDVVVPILRGIDLTVGTVNTTGVRSIYAGLRLR